VPHIRAAKDQEPRKHGYHCNDTDNDEPTRHAILRLGLCLVVQTCLGRSAACCNPAGFMDKRRPKICVFCGSSPGTDPEYAAAARRFGTLLGESNCDLVFGGGYVGLMGVVAHAAKLAGAGVTGILPEFLRYLEPPSPEEEIVFSPGLPERKKMMMDISDAFVALPGGLGTMDEFFEVITAVQLKVFAKPIVLLNVAGFFNPLKALLDDIVAKGFARPDSAALYQLASTPEGVIAALRRSLPRLT
jgi:uncharacterized protein (TIGR00730 family)